MSSQRLLPAVPAGEVNEGALLTARTPPKQRHWIWTLFQNQTAVVGAVLMLIFFVIALLAPLIAPHNPLNLDIPDKLKSPSRQFPMGTDEFGRDILSRVIYGARLSMGVGLSVGIASVTIGLILGLASGYYKKVDPIISRVVDALMAFPALIFAIALMGILGPSITNVIIALTVVYVPGVARVSRSSVLVLREQDYVHAAKSVGVGDWRLMGRYILPNILSPLITQASYIFALAVLSEAALSFVGVGASPEIPSWGNMLSEGQVYVRQAPWIAIFPGIMIVLVVFGANLFGDGLRDALDPRLRGN